MPDLRPAAASPDGGAEFPAGPPAAVVEVFTDGACSPNPGPGGWGAVLRYGSHRRELHGGELATTNNRMELMAAIQALEALIRPADVHLYTDSEYLRKGITQWLAGWQRNGWMTQGRQPVKNADLWRRLHTATIRHRVQWFWVKGHAGHPGNERADQLACQGADEVAGRPPRDRRAARRATAAGPRSS
jgi:ribonuclease HI